MAIALWCSKITLQNQMLIWNFYKPIWPSLAEFQNGHSGQDYNGDQYKGLILLRCGSSLCHLQLPLHIQEPHIL